MRTKLNPREEFVLECRKHWIILIRPFLLVVLFLVYSLFLLFVERGEEMGHILLIVTGVVLLLFIAGHFFSKESGRLNATLGIFLILSGGGGTALILMPEIDAFWVKPAGIALILILPLAHFIWKIIDRRVDLWAVTNQRVIDEYGILSHNARDSVLENIHNVSYSQSLLGRILGYGTVKVQTAADRGMKVYPLVSKPRLLKETITSQQALTRHGSEEPEKDDIRQDEENGEAES